LETLTVMEEEDLVQNSYNLGQHLARRLELWKQYPAFSGFRCRGLWAGIDVNPDIVSGHDFCLRLLDKGIFAKETRTQTIRIAPPLIITQDVLDWGLDQVEEVLIGCV